MSLAASSPDNKTGADAAPAAVATVAVAVAAAAAGGAAGAADAAPFPRTRSGAALPLTVTLVPEFSGLPRGDFAAGALLPVLVVLQSGASSEPRAPLELFMLLDVSGSMGGLRLEQCKAAARAVVGQLSGPDLLHIIAYEAQARLVVSGTTATSNQLLERIDSLVASGSTNIEAALRMAHSMLNASRTTHVKRVFLFSDGEPTTGMQTADELGALASEFAERDWCISAFGIGTGIAPEVMMRISDAGNGAYEWVGGSARDPTSAHAGGRIEEVVKKGFSGLSRLMASRGALTLTALNGAQLAPADQMIGEYTTTGDAKYDTTTRFLTRVRLSDASAAAAAAAGGVAVLRAEFQCLLPDQPLAPPVELTATLLVNVIDGGDAQRPARDPSVALLLTLRDCANVFTRVDTVLERSDVEGAIALLNEVVSMLTPHLEHDIDGVVHVQLRRSQRTLDRLRAEGTRAARRAQLEVGAQRAAIGDRVSAADFASSDSGNRSCTMNSPRGHVGGRGSGGSGGSSPSSPTDDDDDDDDEDFRRQLS
jgi:uncharacterized protein YegL